MFILTQTLSFIFLIIVFATMTTVFFLEQKTMQWERRRFHILTQQVHRLKERSVRESGQYFVGKTTDSHWESCWRQECLILQRPLDSVADLLYDRLFQDKTTNTLPSSSSSSKLPSLRKAKIR